jgi:hypothetical protein
MEDVPQPIEAPLNRHREGLNREKKTQEEREQEWPIHKARRDCGKYFVDVEHSGVSWCLFACTAQSKGKNSDVRTVSRKLTQDCSSKRWQIPTAPPQISNWLSLRVSLSRDCVTWNRMSPKCKGTRLQRGSGVSIRKGF